MPTRTHDPFQHILAPPPNESAPERAAREERERAAKAHSDSIDERLRAEKVELKRKRIVKLLLLGQSESGKSTTLRQFQLQYTPQAFKSERATWRSVIQLNVVRSIRLILDALQEAQQDSLLVSPSAREDSPTLGAVDDDGDRLGRIHWTDEHERLRLRLAPLRHVEALLAAQIRAPPEDGDGEERSIAPRHVAPAASTSQEIAVRPDWKSPFALIAKKPRTSMDSKLEDEFVDEPTEIIHQCRDDMHKLWTDESVRELLRRRKLRIEELSGFFLDDLARLTHRSYFPSSDDVLRARLKTVGVTEYRFQMEMPAAGMGVGVGSEWRIVDVGGTRSQRHQWVPFFDDSNAIIFLAPVSAFDQVLAEDRSVNRLEDSVMLWKMICGNKLLSSIELILFLNKMDILANKLATVRLSKYVRNFGDRPNDLETAAKYFRSKFHAIHREYSTQPRKFYCFTTSVTDVVTTTGILAAVRDVIIREYLKESRLIQ